MNQNLLGISLLVILLFSACATKKKYKHLKQAYSQLQQQLDTTRFQLAETMRSWQKNKDHSSLTTLELQHLTTNLESENKKLKLELTQTKKYTTQLEDSLGKTEEAFRIIQEEWAAITIEQAKMAAKASQISKVLTDSLAVWASPTMHIRSANEFVHFEVNSQVLFKGGYYVNPEGRKLLTQFVDVIKEYPDYRVVVWAVAKKRKNIDVQKQSTKTAELVARTLRELGLNEKRIVIMGLGPWAKPKKKEKPPLGIDLIPNTNPAYH